MLSSTAAVHVCELAQLIAPLETDPQVCDGNGPFVAAFPLEATLRRRFRREQRQLQALSLHDLGMIVRQPLRVVREFGAASFEPSKFSHHVGVIRHFLQVAIFDCFGTILLDCEHKRAFLSWSPSAYVR
jgi:hypothetical protein